MKRKHISSGSRFEKEIAYSRAVAVGEMIFVSGTTGFDYSDMSISEDVAKQAEMCIRNIENALLQADSSLKDIVKVTYILPDANDFEACKPVLRKYFSNILPAATMISAGLSDEKMKIEIEVIAVRSS